MSPDSGAHLTGERSPERDPARVVVAQVTRCRRRLQTLAFVRHVSILASTCLVLVSGFAFWLQPEFAVAATWFGVSLAAAVVGAAVTSLLVTPSLQQTGALIDKQLRLEDRAVTALDLIGMPDPVAHLVVRDASRRLADVKPERTFPLERRFLRLTLIPPTAAALLILLAFAWSLRPDWRADRSTASVGGGGIGRPVSGNASTPAANVAATAPDSKATAAASPSTPSVKREVTSSPGQPVSNSQERTGSAEQSSETPTPATRAAEEVAARTRPGAIPLPSEPNSGSSAESSFGGSQGVSGTGRGAADGAAGRTSSRETSAGGSSPGLGEGAGGVTGSRPAASGSVIQQPQSEETAPYATRYRAAWVKAQASLAQSRVPRRLRDYVRDYFVAIRPGDAE